MITKRKLLDDCYNDLLLVALPMPTSEPGSQHIVRRRERIWYTTLLAATAINCALQITWFWRFRGQNIVMDGIAYIGLARHLVDGNFEASLHGYWSPLISWTIAAASLFCRNFTLMGRLVSIASFLVCLPLHYRLTLKLWRSKSAAALAVFWFSAARGIVALAVGSIEADFMLTACVLLYFTLLLAALRENTPRNWTLLGAAHALAFLAKAFAMPWLSIASLAALAARNSRSPRRLGAALLLAFVVPGFVWLTWGTVLRTKYGTFTTGYQLRANLMVNWRRHINHRLQGDSLAFANAPTQYDSYMVGDSWPEVRSFSFPRNGLPGMIVASELYFLPQALKETLILLNPGGALALAVMAVLLVRNRERFQAEFFFAAIVLLSAAALIVAYCMLVFDGRYVIPIVPLLISICAPILLPADLAPDAPHAAAWLRRLAAGLFLASIVFFATYWASPFRTVDRDFEVSCYRAADLLRGAGPAGTLASIGNGPYPEHGVGFEAGPYVAYFAGWRLVAGNSGLPAESDAEELVRKVLAVKADAVAVWGVPSDPSYARIVSRLGAAAAVSSVHAFSDPSKGEVGSVFILRKN